jgi:hypothetical protein
MTTCSQPVDERSAMPVEELSRDVSQKGGQLRMNPFRNGRPPEGDTEHLTILLDTVVHGKLPEDYQPVNAPPREIINPFRNGRPSEGNTEHLTILLDTVVHEKLPKDYQPVDTPPGGQIPI